MLSVLSGRALTWVCAFGKGDPVLEKLASRMVKGIEWFIRLFEIILSAFLIVGVVSAGVVLFSNLHSVFATGSNSSFQQFLDNALFYIIGLEVALMLIKRDAHLVTDILIFAIARKMIVNMQSGVDFFLAALAILVLYLVKSYGLPGRFDPRRMWENFKENLPEVSKEESEELEHETKQPDELPT